MLSGWLVVQGYFLYMYTALCGQVMSRPLKIVISRPRPGCRAGDVQPSSPSELPHRHFLPGSPSYILAYPEEQLRRSWLVRVGGWQPGSVHGGAGRGPGDGAGGGGGGGGLLRGDAGALPSGDAMGGAAFAALLYWYTPAGALFSVLYACFVGFARVFYWFHWIGDVLVGMAISGLSSFAVMRFCGGYAGLAQSTVHNFVTVIVPFFLMYTFATGMCPVYTVM
eukprot:COSAG01_NODE_9522_length_2421_cov_7.783376_2_plen_223_part_00